jgi:hypothetical protein
LHKEVPYLFDNPGSLALLPLSLILLGFLRWLCSLPYSCLGCSRTVNRRPRRRELVFVLTLPFSFDCKQRRTLSSILVSLLVFPLSESINYFLFSAKSLPFDCLLSKCRLQYGYKRILGPYTDKPLPPLCFCITYLAVEMAATHQAHPHTLQRGFSQIG